MRWIHLSGEVSMWNVLLNMQHQFDICLLLLIWFFSRPFDIFTRSKLRMEPHLINEKKICVFVEHILFAINVTGDFFSSDMFFFVDRISKYNLCIIASFIWREQKRTMKKKQQSAIQLCGHIPCVAIAT